MDQQDRDVVNQGAAVRPVHLVVLGAAGTGKTTIGAGLAERLGLPFGEGDDFHSQANVAKMAAGRALTDEDRWPWLAALRDWMSEQAAAGRSSVVACSALREAYRDVLREADGEVFFIHLNLPEDVNLDRLASRQGHFMKPVMLGSQRAALEGLGEAENGIEAVNIGDPAVVIAEIASAVEEMFGSRLHA
jgi:gluconokinase